MKSAADPRHKKRQQTVKSLFANLFTEQKATEEAQQILKNKKDLDKQISESAPAWPIEKINKIDLAILRLAVYELNLGEAPHKVVIDEAVELAKEYGSENSPAFINGVLGNIMRKKQGKEIKEIEANEN